MESIARFRAGFRTIPRARTTLALLTHSRNYHPAVKPWFVSEEEDQKQPNELFQPSRPIPPLSGLEHVLPTNTPSHIKVLHGILKDFPFLEPNRVRVMPSGTEETKPVPAAPLPSVRQKGRRRARGGTDFGIGVDISPNANEGIWTWLIFAQTKEGVNRRATVNQLLRSCKNSLPDHRFHLSRDSKGSDEPTDGWTLIDAGDFAIHLLNFQAKHKWFPILNL